MNTIDLHMHSTASDGSDTIPELLEKIRRSGITTFSVTDHDTIDGALEMDRLTAGGDLTYIRGVEFSCITPCGKCHILGYRYDPACPAFQEILDLGRELRSRKLSQRLEALDRQFGIRLTEEELAWLLAQTSPGKPHLAQLLVKRGLFPDNRSAISQVLNHCKAPNSRIDGARVVSAILRSGGVPVWAHPLGGEGEPLLSEETFSRQLSCLKEAGLRGLECFYSRYTQEQIRFLRKNAEEQGLLISGGSDYHGKNKVNITLGKLNADCLPVAREQITLLPALI